MLKERLTVKSGTQTFSYQTLLMIQIREKQKTQKNFLSLEELKVSEPTSKNFSLFFLKIIYYLREEERV